MSKKMCLQVEYIQAAVKKTQLSSRRLLLTATCVRARSITKILWSTRTSVLSTVCDYAGSLTFLTSSAYFHLNPSIEASRACRHHHHPSILIMLANCDGLRLHLGKGVSGWSSGRLSFYVPIIIIKITIFKSPYWSWLREICRLQRWEAEQTRYCAE